MKIKTVIIDDEPIAREGIKSYIKRTDILELSGSFADPMQAMNRTDISKTDLLLLDLQMPKMGGFEFLKTIKNPPAVIIITAFGDFALEGFELDVLDYLVKPVSFERFIKAVNKAADFIRLKKESSTRNRYPQNYFFVKSANKFEKINYDDIIYIESLQNYVSIYLNDKKLIVYMTLKSLESSLPSDKFIRVHKSYIIPVDRVESIEGNNIITGNIKIPIGREYKENTAKQIIGNKLLKR